MSDYIDRQAAIDAVGDVHPLDYNSRAIVERLKNLPSADVEPVRHGRWLDAEIPIESGGAMLIQVCNLCNTFYPLAYTGGGHRFCPNCGARMDGEADG